MRWGSGIVHGSPEATMEPGKYWDIATSTTHRLGKLEKVRDLRSMWEMMIYKILYHHVTLLKETPLINRLGGALKSSRMGSYR